MSSFPFSILGRGRLGRALAQALQVPNLPHTARPEGWVALATPDDSLPTLSEAFPGRCWHFSGSLHLPHVPCSHPLTSFCGTPKSWTGVPLALTGSVPTGFVDAMSALGFTPFHLAPEHKARYHAAAVLTSGHAATLWLGAQHLLAEANIQLPGRGLMALAEATLAHIETHGAVGRTGPFVRNDAQTIQRDAAALPEAWRNIFLKLGWAPIGQEPEHT